MRRSAGRLLLMLPFCLAAAALLAGVLPRLLAEPRRSVTPPPSVAPARVAALPAQAPVEAASPPCPPLNWTLLDRAEVSGYVAAIFGAADRGHGSERCPVPDQEFVLRRHGRTLLRWSHFYRLDFLWPGDHWGWESATPRFVDLTGDSRPDLVLIGHFGGNRCGEDYLIVDLHPRPRVVAELKDRCLNLKDVDGDGRWELAGSDNRFDCWPVGGAGAPFPAVVVRVGRSGARLASELRPRRETSRTLVMARAAAIRRSPRWADRLEKDVEVNDIACSAVDLIYTGHADLAWEYIDAAWPPNAPGRHKFRLELKERLRRSDYYDDLVRLNHGRLF